MQKEVVTHIIYASVLLVVIAVFGVLQYQTHENVGLLLQGQQNLQNDVNSLQQKDVELETTLQVLDKTVTDKGEEIKSLSGEIKDVQDTSAKALDALQNKVVNLQSQYEDFSDVIQEVLPSVVSVETDVGSGSGFIYDSSGYIITNNHVIAGARSGQVRLSSGKTLNVRIVGTDEKADVAVLFVNTSKKLTPLDLDAQVTLGEKVIAVGNPGGLDFSVTQGIVSATDREDSKGNKYVQIDVPINPGNSGGPLINAKGRVIGMNTLKISSFEGVGFALRADFVKDVVQKILADAK